MARKSYTFQSKWNIDAPIGAVWKAIIDTGNWTKWWPFLESVEWISNGNSDGTGSIFRFVWKGNLPYSLAFQMEILKIEFPKIIEAAASGDLYGTGRWILASENANATRVEYQLNVQSTKPWMNILAPALSWFFKWNHNRVMAAGRDGLIHYMRFAENGQTERSYENHLPGPSRISP